MTTAQISRAQLLADMPRAEREIFFMSLTPEQSAHLRHDWTFWARPAQMTPQGDWWSVWLILAGRGFGKTRTGSEFVREQVCGPSPLIGGRYRRIALVGETAADVRDVMVEGPSGILAVHPPHFRPKYVPSLRKLTWPNGAVAHTYSADDPEQLRGPEHDLAWSDELAKWRYAQETWDMLQFGLRQGSPRQLATTTPRPIPIVRELLADENELGGTVVTRGSTYDNAGNLAPKFLLKMKKKYEGTRLGRQELHAEVLDDVPGALWTRAMLDMRSPTNPLGARMSPSEMLPDMQRIVVGVDPSGSSGEDDDGGDDIGIVAAGLGVDDIIYVLVDNTCNLPPGGWARRAVDTFHARSADLIVGERNFGGAMVEYTIRTIDRRVPYKDVVASRGKVVRAEPVAALYEQGRVRHAGTFAAMEDEMIHMTRDGYIGSASPNRVDAMVWAVHELAFGVAARSSTRSVRGAY